MSPLEHSDEIPRAMSTAAADGMARGMEAPELWERACTGATRGGRTSPVSSPCTMMHTPMLRVVSPQLFCHTSERPPSVFSNSMPNIFAKFCGRNGMEGRKSH